LRKEAHLFQGCRTRMSKLLCSLLGKKKGCWRLVPQMLQEEQIALVLALAEHFHHTVRDSQPECVASSQSGRKNLPAFMLSLQAFM
jgi:hypothetical protein